jgi:hypothetical protein
VSLRDKVLAKCPQHWGRKTMGKKRDNIPIILGVLSRGDFAHLGKPGMSGNTFSTGLGLLCKASCMLGKCSTLESHLQSSGDTFDCYSWGRGSIGIDRAEVWDAANTLQCRGRPPVTRVIQVAILVVLSWGRKRKQQEL